MPCEFVDKSGKSILVNTAWNLTLSEYVDKVLEKEDEWTEDQMALVDEMITVLEIYKAENAPDGGEDVLPDDAILPEENEEED